MLCFEGCCCGVWRVNSVGHIYSVVLVVYLFNCL